MDKLGRTQPIKSALFLDFDNVYSGLRRINQDAAEDFATNPSRWLSWIEQGLKKDANSSEPSREREILVRRCYLNPNVFWKYRQHFTRSAFNVVDCPPLTQQGKNSSDIHMVLDILDSIQHPTHFDEFIIFSGDSDFTPVLLRLRAFDRRTMIITGSPAAQSYKAASNLVITGSDFIAGGLKNPDARNVESSPESTSEGRTVEVSTTTIGAPVVIGGVELPASSCSALGERIVDCARQFIETSQEPVSLAALGNLILKRVGPQVSETQWDGFGGLKKFLKAKDYLGFQVDSRPNGTFLIYDPRRHYTKTDSSARVQPWVGENHDVHIN
jgi:hypothetical protein